MYTSHVSNLLQPIYSVRPNDSLMKSPKEYMNLTSEGHNISAALALDFL